MQADDTNYEVATVDVEDIFIDTGAGTDVVMVTGTLNGTGLAQSTITADTGSGDDIIDLRDRTSPHRVVADGERAAPTRALRLRASSVISVTEIFDTNGTSIIGANIKHLIGGVRSPTSSAISRASPSPTAPST